MIIEMLLPITETHTLAASWEFPQSLWESKEQLLRGFINEVFSTEKISFNEKKWQENVVFELNAKPYHFYEIQDCFNDYFKSIGAIVLVE